MSRNYRRIRELLQTIKNEAAKAIHITNEENEEDLVDDVQKIFDTVDELEEEFEKQ